MEERLIREYQIPESVVDAGWMIGARTRLVDAWAPMPELMQLPKLLFRDGSVRITQRKGVTHLGLPTSRMRLLKWYARGRHRIPTIYADVPVFDSRFDGAENFAHAICYTGLLALAAKRALFDETGSDSLMMIVPGDARAYVLQALNYLGVTAMPTFGPVVGDIVTITQQGHSALLRLAHEFMPKHIGTLLESGPATPEKIFISRRKSRCIENESEIAALLEARGFLLIYAEDLSVLDQMRYLTNASQIVAIHGAALGPLLCRSAISNRKPLRLLEIFGPGFVCTFYRQIMFGLGDSWISVRGRVKPEVVRDTDHSGIAHAHEKSSFYVDPESLIIAFDALEKGGSPSYTVSW